jgi:hypothetical protein
MVALALLSERVFCFSAFVDTLILYYVCFLVSVLND